MAKRKTRTVAGPVVVHTFNGGFSKDRKTRAWKQVSVPTRQLVWEDPTAGRYGVIDGRLRRLSKPRPPSFPTWRQDIAAAIATMAPAQIMSALDAASA